MMRLTVARLTFKFISCCHDQNHNSYVVAIKILEKHIKSHFENYLTHRTIFNAFMFGCVGELKTFNA